MLLENFGGCLSYLRRYDESVETLKEMHDIADKITQKNCCCRAKVYCGLAITCSSQKRDCKEAAGYAYEAINMLKFLESYKVEKLRKIIQTAEENESAMNRLQVIANVQGTDLQSQLKSCIPDKPQHGIIIIFTSLSDASTVPDVTPRLCHVVGVNPGESGGVIVDVLVKEY